MAAQTNTGSKKLVWIGWVLSVLPVLLLVFSAVVKLMRSAPVVEGFQKLGFPDRTIVPIGITELLCALIYIIPQTAVLGAILLTGYLGGATVTQLRAGESIIAPILVGVVVWLGLFLRDPRLRDLLPLRR
jgi:hypothetical protein